MKVKDIDHLIYLKEVKKKTFKEIGQMQKIPKSKQWASQVIRKEQERKARVDSIHEQIMNGEINLYKTLDSLVR